MTNGPLLANQRKRKRQNKNLDKAVKMVKINETESKNIEEDSLAPSSELVENSPNLENPCHKSQKGQKSKGITNFP